MNALVGTDSFTCSWVQKRRTKMPNVSWKAAELLKGTASVISLYFCSNGPIDYCSALKITVCLFVWLFVWLFFCWLVGWLVGWSYPFKLKLDYFRKWLMIFQITGSEHCPSVSDMLSCYRFQMTFQTFLLWCYWTVQLCQSYSSGCFFFCIVIKS